LNSLLTYPKLNHMAPICLCSNLSPFPSLLVHEIWGRSGKLKQSGYRIFSQNHRLAIYDCSWCCRRFLRTSPHLNCPPVPIKSLSRSLLLWSRAEEVPPGPCDLPPDSMFRDVAPPARTLPTSAPIDDPSSHAVSIWDCGSNLSV